MERADPLGHETVPVVYVLSFAPIPLAYVVSIEHTVEFDDKTIHPEKDIGESPPAVGPLAKDTSFWHTSQCPPRKERRIVVIYIVNE
jgi:hypothetical protein